MNVEYTRKVLWPGDNSHDFHQFIANFKTMAQTFSVSFIGAGNVAWHLAPALDNAGYVIKEVYSRHPSHAEALTERLYQAEVKGSLDFSTSGSKLFIIAVTDDAIESIVQEIVLPEDALLVHTSGSVPLEVLTYAAAAQNAVFYPLQTFSKSKRLNFQGIPIFIETTDDKAWETLMSLAKTLTSRIQRIASTERIALHVAAVFASNFSNHMLALSQDILKQNRLSFDLLKPLIAETIQKSLDIGPEAAQTGPARRGDLHTLDRHLAFLQGDEIRAKVYRLISQQILDKYEPE